MAFYGKNNDEKHYNKIAKKILEINPSLTVQVVDEDHEFHGEVKRVKVIRVFTDFDHVGHKFWVGPWSGGFFGYWLYAEGIPQTDGGWVNNWGDTAHQLGELEPSADGYAVKGFMYTHFASVMASAFFYPIGPLRK